MPFSFPRRAGGRVGATRDPAGGRGAHGDQDRENSVPLQWRRLLPRLIDARACSGATRWRPRSQGWQHPWTPSSPRMLAFTDGPSRCCAKEKTASGPGLSHGLPPAGGPASPLRGGGSPGRRPGGPDATATAPRLGDDPHPGGGPAAQFPAPPVGNGLRRGQPPGARGTARATHHRPVGRIRQQQPLRVGDDAHPGGGPAAQFPAPSGVVTVRRRTKAATRFSAGGRGLRRGGTGPPWRGRCRWW
jgi:hypothetical protein